MNSNVSITSAPVELVDVTSSLIFDCIPLHDENDVYIFWVAEDNSMVAFYLCKDIYKGVMIKVLTKHMLGLLDKKPLNFTIMKNPNNLPDSAFKQKEFVDLLSFAINDMLSSIWKVYEKECVK